MTSARTHPVPRPARDDRAAAARAGAGGAGGGQVRRGGTGLSLGILSAAAFGTSGAFAASLIGAGWSPAAAVLTRITLAGLMLTVPALLQLRGHWGMLRRAAPRVGAFGLVGVAGCQLFYFNAVARMPVGVALLLEYLGTVLVVGWLWARHAQRPRRLTVTGAAASVAGLILVLNLTGTAGINLIGVMWGLLAAVSLAIYFLLSAATDAEQVPPIVMAWAGMWVGAVVLGLLGWAGVLPMSASTRPVQLPAPPGQLGRASPRAVAGGGGDRLRGRHRRRPAARRQAGLVHRHGRGAVRRRVRVGPAWPATVRDAVPGRRVHPRRGHPGPGGRVARAG